MVFAVKSLNSRAEYSKNLFASSILNANTSLATSFSGPDIDAIIENLINAIRLSLRLKKVDPGQTHCKELLEAFYKASHEFTIICHLARELHKFLAALPPGMTEFYDYFINALAPKVFDVASLANAAQNAYNECARKHGLGQLEDPLLKEYSDARERDDKIDQAAKNRIISHLAALSPPPLPVPTSCTSWGPGGLPIACDHKINGWKELKQEISLATDAARNFFDAVGKTLNVIGMPVTVMAVAGTLAYVYNAPARAANVFGGLVMKIMYPEKEIYLAGGKYKFDRYVQVYAGDKKGSAALFKDMNGSGKEALIQVGAPHPSRFYKDEKQVERYNVISI